MICNICLQFYNSRLNLRIYTYIIMLLVFASCRGRHEQLASKEDVTVDVMLPTTPVKDQGQAPLCWIYAMLATIETDRLAEGDSVNLSATWLARKSLEEQAVEAYLTGCDISMRGTLPEAMRLYEQYGIIGYNAAPDKETLTTTVVRQLAHTAKTMAAQHKGIEAMNDAVSTTLDDAAGVMPRFVFMLGMEYTPLEFAHSCAMPGQWQAYTSFTHHPYNEPFVLELKDNRQRHAAMNVPLDSLYNMVVSSLRHRHPVAWEGRVSLRSKLRSEGVKELSHAGDYTSLRQRAFESFRLTDDHCLAIVGLGHRKDGTPVFICKNSWGKHDSRIYMTKEQFLMSTILVMVKNNHIS